MKNLESMTLAELRELQEEIATLIPKRQEQERAAVIAKIDAMAADAGFSLEELLAYKGKKSSVPKAKSTDKRSTVAPKYRDKATGAMWTGRGKKPKWVEAALASGKTLADLAIG